MNRLTIFLVLIAGMMGSTVATAETTIGRWCDKMVPTMSKYNYVMAIVITDEGKVVLRSRYNDGSSGEDMLREIGGGIYATIDNRFGEKYRIVPNNGELQLIDNDGLIRIASRLENKPQPGECR
jgi:hypothetical protein